MKALVAHSYGPLDELAVVDVPRPTPGPGQLLLRVQAAALNPIDARLVTGELSQLFPISHPFVVGMDAAGLHRQPVPRHAARTPASAGPAR